MARNLSGVCDALTNQDINMTARTIYAWILASQKKSVTITDVAEAMSLHRVTAAQHMNTLREHQLLERFLGPDAHASHHWRLPA